jgi:cytidylate kinase
MAFQVVCLSAVDGSGAEQVGPLVAERLGYRLVNEEIVARAARLADLDPEVVAEVEMGMWWANRLLDSLSAAPDMNAAMAGAPMPLPLDDIPTSADMRDLIRAAIHQIAEEGRAVIVAHAASFALSGRGDTLRVFLTASPETRQSRLNAGAKQLAKLDANRADYLLRFYRIDAERQHHYDLVLNTDRLEPKAAAELIARVATA